MGGAANNRPAFLLMAIDTTRWAADLALIVADLATSATFEDGQVVSGTASHVTKSGQNAIEGVYPDYDVEWVAPTSSFTDTAVTSPRKKVIIGSQTYYVQDRMTGQISIKLRLSLR